MNSARSNGSRPASFTFAELLGAIAAVSVLAVSIQPALSDANAKARAAFCTNNLKQWGVGFQLYAADWNGYLPSEGTVAGTGLSSKESWYNAVPPYLKMLRYSDARMHFPFERLRIWVCPEKNLRNAKSISGLNSIFYGMNDFLDGTDIDDVPHHTWLHVKLSAVSKPDAAVLLCDVYANQTYCDPMDATFQTYPWQKDGQGLHQNGANFLFVDGHASWFPVSAYWVGSAGITNNPSLRWYP